MPKTATKDKTSIRVRTAFITMCLSAIALALFQSNGLVSWGYDLPINPLTETLVTLLETWNGWMEQLGLTEMSENVSDWVQSLQDATF